MEIVNFIKNDIKAGTLFSLDTESKKQSKDGSSLRVKTHMVCSTKKNYANTIHYNPSARGRRRDTNTRSEILVPYAVKTVESTGNTLLTVYVSKTNPVVKEYIKNGKAVTKDEFYASAKTAESAPSAIKTLNIKDIKRIKQSDRIWNG